MATRQVRTNPASYTVLTQNNINYLRLKIQDRSRNKRLWYQFTLKLYKRFFKSYTCI